jgi:acyl-CoA synthetase (AMP-forming)/AMP-acid ligase II
MITHYNIIANILQVTTYESFQMAGCTEVGTGAIPFTHSYGLDLGHIAVYRGDSIVVFPRFDMQLLLKSVPQYQVQRLYLVRSAIPCNRRN